MQGGASVYGGAEFLQDMEHRCSVCLNAAFECAEHADIACYAAQVYSPYIKPVHQVIYMSSGSQVPEDGIFLYVFLIAFLEYLHFPGSPVKRLNHRRVDTCTDSVLHAVHGPLPSVLPE